MGSVPLGQQPCTSQCRAGPQQQERAPNISLSLRALGQIGGPGCGQPLGSLPTAVTWAAILLQGGGHSHSGRSGPPRPGGVAAILKATTPAMAPVWVSSSPVSGQLWGQL